MRLAPFLIIIGLGGGAILVALGVWQVQRLAWKEGVVADIEARMAAEPEPLPQMPDPARDTYLPVSVTGIFGPEVLRVLVSQKEEGAGYRLISPLRMDGAQGTIMVDRGFVRVAAQPDAVSEERITITGNLQWPDETDGFTPAPDQAENIWFARDVDAMAAYLDTRPVLLVARSVSFEPGNVTPLPVDTAAIPNNHLQYAITWFSLAAIWLAMSVYFLRARRPRTES